MWRNRPDMSFFSRCIVLLCVWMLCGLADASSAPAAGIGSLEVVTSDNDRAEFHFNVQSETDKALVVLAVFVRERLVDARQLHVRGDIGLVEPGGGKTIVWDMKADFPDGYSGPVSGELNAHAAWVEPVTKMLFVRVAGQCFEMGCGTWNPVCDNDELPTRRVCPDDFWIGVDEVSNAQFCVYLDEAGGSSDAAGYPGIEVRNGKHVPVQGQADKAVGSVTWLKAMDYARWLSQKTGERFALPSEAQWEYACRNQGRWHAFATMDGTMESLKAQDMDAPLEGIPGTNLLGLHAMSGGQWEWTLDTYVPDNEAQRVLRGGRDGSQVRHARCANRYARDPGSTDAATGFRLVRIPAAE